MKNIFNILNEGFQNKYILEAEDTSSKHLKGNFYAEWIPEVFETGAYRIYNKRFPEQTISYVDSIDEVDYSQLKESWIDKLPKGVRNRLGNCRSSHDDIETLVNVKWQSMKEEGKDKKGFTKEDALVSILDLLDSNGQFVDLTKDEYDELKEELNIDEALEFDGIVCSKCGYTTDALSSEDFICHYCNDKPHFLLGEILNNAEDNSSSNILIFNDDRISLANINHISNKHRLGANSMILRLNNNLFNKLKPLINIHDRTSVNSGLGSISIDSLDSGEKRLFNELKNKSHRYDSEK